MRDVAVVVPHRHPIWGRGFWLVNRVRSWQPFFFDAPCVPLAFLMRRELKRRPELSPKGKGSESAWMVWRACGSEQSGATERGLAASPSALRPTPMIGGLPVPRERPSSFCVRARWLSDDVMHGLGAGARRKLHLDCGGTSTQS